MEYQYFLQLRHLFRITPPSVAVYAVAVCVRKWELATMHTNRHRVHRRLHGLVRCILALSTASTLELRTIKSNWLHTSIYQDIQTKPISEELRMAWALHTYWNLWTTTPNPASNSRSVNSIAWPILWWSLSSTKPIHRITAMNLTKPIFAEAFNCTRPSLRSRLTWPLVLYAFISR